MHAPAAAAAGLPDSSGGLSTMQSYPPYTVAGRESPICRGCAQLLLPLRRQRQPQRKARRVSTALACRAQQPGKRASMAVATAAAECKNVRNISATCSQTKWRTTNHFISAFAALIGSF